MTVPALPPSPPPPALYPKLLPLLISQLSSTAAAPPILPALQTALHILAALKLRPPRTPIPTSTSTTPLSSLLDLSNTHPGILKPPVLIDAIIAYPNHSPTIIDTLSNVFDASPATIESFRIDVLPELVGRLKSADSQAIAIAAKVLLGMIRGHEELVALALEDSEDVLRSLASAYDNLGAPASADGAGASEMTKTGAKSDTLMICRELVVRVGTEGATGEAMLRFMGSEKSSSGGTMDGHGLREDCEALLRQGGFHPPPQIKSILESQRDASAGADPRVQAILALFPTIPPHLLLEALSHPRFSSLPSGSRATPTEQAEPVLMCVLNGGEGLPEELKELGEIVKKLATEGEVVNGGAPKAQKTSGSRRNAWNEEELGRLKIKDDDSAIPVLNTSIPDHLRASIMRLVETQAEEEEERRRALAGAGVLDVDSDDEDGDVPVRVKVSSGDSEDSENVDDETGIKLEKSAQKGKGMSDKQRYDILRTQYIEDASVFDRDGVTRRGDQRKKLREKLGWDDGQIEGWKVMLERDPNKDAILEAHRDKISRSGKQGNPRNNGKGKERGGNQGSRDPSVAGSVAESSSGGGGRGGRGGRGRGGGGGGGNRENKSSRGHANAARTRGHDRKMRGMGI
ncbi:hypothetical protein IAT38_006029 [Cryptococcus sp. DSM 104549]